MLHLLFEVHGGDDGFWEYGNGILRVCVSLPIVGVNDGEQFADGEFDLFEIGSHTLFFEILGKSFYLFEIPCLYHLTGSPGSQIYSCYDLEDNLSG